VFTGEYRHAVDDKGRLAIPSRFRAPLDGGVVVARWLDECLAIHTMSAWNVIGEKVAALPISDPRARLLQRRLFAGAFETELDRQGRLLLPLNLRSFAGIDAEATVIGSQGHVEIWAPERWEGYSRELEDPQAFAAAIAGIGF
jgi:MraZ protein